MYGVNTQTVNDNSASNNWGTQTLEEERYRGLYYKKREPFYGNYVTALLVFIFLAICLAAGLLYGLGKAKSDGTSSDLPPTSTVAGPLGTNN